MADLPDLDTSNVSFLAYWNAIDQGGATEIDPENVLSDSKINSYELYDNGVIITDYTWTFRAAEPNVITRVKSDGWFVSYITRYSNFDTGVNSPDPGVIDGWWDVVYNWGDVDNNVPDFDRDTLTRTIERLQGELGNSNITFNPGDVSLYNYQFDSATDVTVPADADGTSPNITGGFSYTQGTDIYAAVVSTKTSDVGSSFAGFTITTSNSSQMGSVDLLENNLIPNSGTEYNADITSGQSFASGTFSGVVLWG